jgi:hypothetical protein
MTPAQDKVVFRTDYHYKVRRDVDGMLVELHWSLAPPHFCASPDLEDLWARAATVSVGGHSVRTLSREDLLLFLCVHGSKHAWAELEWIVGVAELIRAEERIDWTSVIELAESLGVARMLRLGACLAGALLDAPVPSEVAGWLRSDPQVQSLELWVSGRLFRDPEHASDASDRFHLLRFHLRSKGRIRDRARHLYGELAIPTTHEWDLVTIPGALLPLYSMLRPIRLVGKYGRTLLRRLR